MEEEERRLPSPSAPGARRDSPPAPARALAGGVAGGDRRRVPAVPLLLYRRLSSKPAALRTYCLCPPRSPPPPSRPARPLLPSRCPGRGPGRSRPRWSPPRPPGAVRFPGAGRRLPLYGERRMAAGERGWLCSTSHSGERPQSFSFGDPHGRAVRAAPCLAAQHGTEPPAPPGVPCPGHRQGQNFPPGTRTHHGMGQPVALAGQEPMECSWAWFGPTKPPGWDAALRVGRGMRTKAGSRQGFVLIQVSPSFSSPSPSCTAEREGAGRAGCQPAPVFGSRQLGSSPSAGMPAEPLLRNRQSNVTRRAEW